MAPEALSRFYADVTPGRHGPTSTVGATWMTREDRENEIRDYVAYLDEMTDHVCGDLASAPRLVAGGAGSSPNMARRTPWMASVSGMPPWSN